MTMAVGAFAVSFNVFATRHLPFFEGVILVMFLIGFFVVIIPLWVLAPRASVGDVFGKFENFGGWSTMGGACVVGQMAASAAFIVSCFVETGLSRSSLLIFVRYTGCRQRCSHGRGSERRISDCSTNGYASISTCTNIRSQLTISQYYLPPANTNQEKTPTL
jgi:hypothetical protein